MAINPPTFSALIGLGSPISKRLPSTTISIEESISASVLFVIYGVQISASPAPLVSGGLFFSTLVIIPYSCLLSISRHSLHIFFPAL